MTKLVFYKIKKVLLGIIKKLERLTGIKLIKEKQTGEKYKKKKIEINRIK